MEALETRAAQNTGLGRAYQVEPSCSSRKARATHQDMDDW